jgi:hypothetical protein
MGNGSDFGFTAWLALVCVAGLFVSGCGYTWSENGNSFSAQSAGASGSVYRTNVKTVAIPIFANKTFYRGLEFNLSKAVVTQLEGRTPYRVAPKESADTLLTGEIINVQVHNISRSPSNALPQEQLLVINVNFVWKDLRTGQIYTERRGFEQSAPYYPTLGEDQTAGTQDNIEKLALAIVEELQAPWGKAGNSTK